LTKDPPVIDPVERFGSFEQLAGRLVVVLTLSRDTVVVLGFEDRPHDPSRWRLVRTNPSIRAANSARRLRSSGAMASHKIVFYLDAYANI